MPLLMPLLITAFLSLPADKYQVRFPLRQRLNVGYLFLDAFMFLSSTCQNQAIQCNLPAKSWIPAGGSGNPSLR